MEELKVRKDWESLKVLPYISKEGKIFSLMFTGYEESVVLNQKEGIVSMRAGDVCRIGCSLEKGIIVGFSDENNFSDPNSLLTKVWIIPKEKTRASWGLEFGYWLIRYPGDYFDIINIEILKKTRSPLTLGTTKRRIIKFLNSET